MADKTFVTVSFERIQRVVDILSMVSIGEYDPQLIQIEPNPQADEFSVLEAALNIYNQELASARQQNEQYIAEMERSKRELQEQISTIARQQQAIHELSTPIVEIWEDILLLPIVSSLDSQRAAEMTEKLLERVKSSRGRCIIIDITGVELVDTNTANAMCVLTGIRPEIARTMVQLGVELEGIKTMRSLKDGLRECFAFLHKLKQQETQAAQSEHGGALGLLQPRRKREKSVTKADAATEIAESSVSLAPAPSPSTTSMPGD